MNICRRGSRRVLATEDYNIIFGAPTPRLVNKKGQYRLACGAVPGVACIHKMNIQVTSEPMRSEAGRQLWAQGRLQALSIAHSHGMECRLMNIYAPSAPDLHQDREDFYVRLACENEHHSGPMIIAGDWNYDPAELAMVATLQSLGWILPQWVTEQGGVAHATYKQANIATRIDSFLLSPKVSCTHTQVVRAWPTLQHKIVECAIPNIQGIQAQSIQYPPRLSVHDAQAASDYDWTWVHQGT